MEPGHLSPSHPVAISPARGLGLTLLFALSFVLPNSASDADSIFLTKAMNDSLWQQSVLEDPDTPTLVEVEPPPSRWRRSLTGLSWLAVLAVGVVLVGEVRKASRGQGAWARAAAPALLLVIAAGFAVWATHSSLITSRRAEGIVSALLHNVYRAFDLSEQEMILECLEHSVAGELLDQTYLEIGRSLELAGEGGTRAGVTNIEMAEVAVKGSSGRSFTARCTWNVTASVLDWGHIHQRTNRFQAQLTIAPVDGLWKITSFDLVGDERP